MNVIPIQSSNYIGGCGFFVGHHFITAGHVIKSSVNPAIFLNQKRIYLTNPYFLEDNERDPNGYDLAIYDIEHFRGELELESRDMEYGTILKSQSFRSLGEEFVECDIEVNDYKNGNYFGGLSSINLKSGSSGSPVILGNKVAGMIVKGNNNGLNIPVSPDYPLNFCLFLSSIAINKVLNAKN